MTTDRDEQRPDVRQRATAQEDAVHHAGQRARGQHDQHAGQRTEGHGQDQVQPFPARIGQQAAVKET